MILVTGASGLVGGHLLWHLLQNNHSIIAIKRHETKLRALTEIFSFYTSDPMAYLNRITWKIADVLDPVSIHAAMSGVSEVYHCAAIVSLSNAEQGMLETNVLGTRNMVEAAHKNAVKNFCFVSSIAALGKAKGNGSIDELCLWDEQSVHSNYSKSKYLAEQEVWNAIGKGLPAVIVNPGVILGVSGTEKGSSMLFSRVRKGLPFYTFGGTGFVDVRDVVQGMILLMEKKCFGERYILVAENLSNKTLLDAIAIGFNKRKPCIPLSKNVLLVIATIAETVSKMMGVTTPLDRASARTASNRNYYSNQKFLTTFQSFRFITSMQSVKDICRHLI